MEGVVFGGSMMKRLIWGGLAATILIVGVLGAWRFGFLSPDKTPVLEDGPYLRGVDVAHYQGRIDWEELADHDISFAFIKATEGGDWVDPKFRDNWIGAKRAGLRRGAYHFFTLCRDAGEQAAHFLETVGDMSGALLPVLDAEHLGPCKESAVMRDVAGGVLTFLDEVHGATGTRPVIYTTKTFYEAHLEGKTPGERFWLRSLINPPRYGPVDWRFWQYSGNGRRRGVSGPIDLNIFNGDEAALEALRVP